MSERRSAARIADLRTEILPDHSNPQLLVHVTSEDALNGTGETWWGTYQPHATPGTPVEAIASFIDTVLAPICIGADSTAIEALWHSMVRRTAQYGPEGIVSIAISGIDLALWDLLGRRREMPVHSLLARRVHDTIPAYASLHWLGDVTAIVADAERAISAGFGAVKLHETDPSIILAVRESLPAECRIMVDMSGHAEEATAFNMIERLTPAGLGWIEEPLYPYQDHAALARLRTHSRTPLAAGENEFSVAGFERLLDAGAVDVLQPDLVKCGGLTPASSIAELAARHDVELAPHNFSLGPSLCANIHWAVTATNARWIEIPWLPEGQHFPSPMTMPTLIEGAVAPADAPGLTGPR